MQGVFEDSENLLRKSTPKVTIDWQFGIASSSNILLENIKQLLLGFEITSRRYNKVLMIDLDNPSKEKFSTIKFYKEIFYEGENPPLVVDHSKKMTYTGMYPPLVALLKEVLKLRYEYYGKNYKDYLDKI